jgi:hypothetical protein
MVISKTKRQKIIYINTIISMNRSDYVAGNWIEFDKTCQRVTETGGQIQVKKSRNTKKYKRVSEDIDSRPGY